jgi:hypothetical protein
MSRQVKINAYGKEFSSIREFVKHYNTSTTLYYRFYNELDENTENRYRRAALNLIEHILSSERSIECYAYGMYFPSINSCCRHFCLSQSTIYKMMKYNPNIEQCLDKVLGKDKYKYIKQSKVNKLINKFIYGKNYFTDLCLQYSGKQV